MFKYLRQLIEQPELPEPVERERPTLPNREGRSPKSRHRQDHSGRRRYHERHATRARRKAKELMTQAKSGQPAW